MSRREGETAAAAKRINFPTRSGHLRHGQTLLSQWSGMSPGLVRIGRAHRRAGWPTAPTSLTLTSRDARRLLPQSRRPEFGQAGGTRAAASRAAAHTRSRACKPARTTTDAPGLERIKARVWNLSMLPPPPRAAAAARGQPLGRYVLIEGCASAPTSQRRLPRVACCGLGDLPIHFSTAARTSHERRVLGLCASTDAVI